MSDQKLSTTPPGSGREAREQATEYRSPFADRELVFDDGTRMVLPPHPSWRMLDDDVLEAYEAYLEEVESYDRHDTGLVKGPPYYKDGKRVTPPREVRIVQIILGDRAYEVLRSKTLNGRQAAARDVWRSWSEQLELLRERQSEDSKSDGRAVDLAAVSTPDSK